MRSPPLRLPPMHSHSKSHQKYVQHLFGLYLFLVVVFIDYLALDCMGVLAARSGSFVCSHHTIFVPLCLRLVYSMVYS